MEKIVVGGIIRDRAALVPIWVGGLVRSAQELLRACARITTTTIHIEYLFIDDMSKDDTVEELKTQCMSYNISTSSIIYSLIETDKDSTAIRPNYSYKRLALLRDLLMYYAFKIKNATYLFSVDSDIHISKDCLYKLYSTQHPLIGGIIRNSKEPRIFNILNKDSTTPNGYSRRTIPKDTLLNDISPVDLTGACILIHKDVYTKGARYYNEDDLKYGEDVSFCNACERLDIPRHIRTDVNNTHYMSNTSILNSLPYTEKDYA